MKTRSTAYWIITALVALAFAGGGVMDLAHASPVREMLAGLGYPTYFMSILGAWKVLGAAAIVAPGALRLKEWAYAGMFFDLSGAVASHLLAGEGIVAALPPFVLGALVISSWALRPEQRVLAPAARSPRPSLEPTRRDVPLPA
jgi:thiosulfate reductase cytochrome b subunit